MRPPARSRPPPRRSWPGRGTTAASRSSQSTSPDAARRGQQPRPGSGQPDRDLPQRPAPAKGSSEQRQPAGDAPRRALGRPARRRHGDAVGACSRQRPGGAQGAEQPPPQLGERRAEGVVQARAGAAGRPRSRRRSASAGARPRARGRRAAGPRRGRASPAGPWAGAPATRPQHALEVGAGEGVERAEGLVEQPGPAAPESSVRARAAALAHAARERVRVVLGEGGQAEAGERGPGRAARPRRGARPTASGRSATLSRRVRQGSRASRWGMRVRRPRRRGRGRAVEQDLARRRARSARPAPRAACSCRSPRARPARRSRRARSPAQVDPVEHVRLAQPSG